MRELEKLTSIRYNPKALYAKGTANMMLDDFIYARQHFLMAMKVSPDPQIEAAIEELNQREQAKIIHQERSKRQLQLFKEEASRAAEEARFKAEIRRKEDEALQIRLEKFKGDLQVSIQEFKEDDDIQRLSLRAEDWTHFHIDLAETLCNQNDVILKGAQMINENNFYYYLSK